MALDPETWPADLEFMAYVKLVRRYLASQGWAVLDPKSWSLCFVRAEKDGAYLDLIVHGRDTLGIPALIKAASEWTLHDTHAIGILTRERVLDEVRQEAERVGVFLVSPDALADVIPVIRRLDARLRADAAGREAMRLGAEDVTNDTQPAPSALKPATQSPVYVTDDRPCTAEITALLSGDAPVFLARVGGSDTDAVAALLQGKHDKVEKLWLSIWRHRNITEKFNGFYDVTANDDIFWRYVNDLLGIYERMTHAFIVGSKMLTLYMPTTISPTFLEKRVESKDGFDMLMTRAAGRELRCYPYPFVERLTLGQHSLLRVLAEVLPGKRVLVVSPFERSIRQNFHQRRDFFKNFDYPDFDLLTVNTPITYHGLPRAFYPHENWFETADALRAEVSKQGFDVALLACGSYAMPLGEHIAQNMGKKAVYVGGLLQLMFGVTGRRYDKPFFADQCNLDSFIRPVEAEGYLRHVDIPPDMVREAFGAYF